MSNDLELIKQLEKEINRKLEKIELAEIINGTKNGFAVNENEEVTGLNLDEIHFVRSLMTISKFHRIKKLSLYGTIHSDLPFLQSSLQDLINLKELDLSYNEITDISFLQALSNLSTLYLGGNKITDISFLQGLSNLSMLDLSSNLLIDYSFLQSLNNLTNLNLRNTQLSDISFLQGLSNLTKVNLRSNQLTDISFLQGLTNLKELDLSDNQLTDISFLQGLKNLKKLDLRNNKIKELPEAIIELDMKIDVDNEFGRGDGILLNGNPLETPPLEIVEKGKEAIKAYFKDLKKGKALPLNEVKVLLVGDGGAGKTSLMRQLLGQTFDKNEEKTDGINIEDWKVGKEEKEINAHIWDFGGQEIMHATHQFFLSKRSFYILVLDGRKDEKTEYWLKHIESFGGNSPVLVVINKIDENPGFDVNRKFLQEKYKNIKGFHRVSCKTKKGMDTFTPALEEALAQMEMIETTWAEAWFNVKKQLEHMADHFISYNQYLTLCTGEKVDEKSSQDTLVDFLNDLGVVLHFKDLELEDTYVLEPKWVTEAVYKIINSEILAKCNGVLKLSLLKKILKQKDEDDYYYPPDKYRYIIELMNKFELCYKLDGERVLIPDLLEVEESRFDFDYKNSLKFIIEYDFLPKSVMPRFIVRRHKDITEDLQWRTGVVLEDKAFYSTAVVKSDERDRKIYIYVNGGQKRDYFAIIRKTLRDINDSFEKLKTTEWVPLPGSDEVAVEYEELIGHEQMGTNEIVIGKLRKRYRVSDLLIGIEKPAERKYIERKMPQPGREPSTEDIPVSTPEGEKGIWKIIARIGIILAILGAIAAIIQLFL